MANNRRRPGKFRQVSLWGGVVAVATLGGFFLSQMLSDRRPQTAQTDETVRDLGPIRAQSKSESRNDQSSGLLRNGEFLIDLPPETPDDAAELTFERLALIDPEAAARAFVGEPEDSNREEMLEVLLRVWSDRDPARAADWAADLPMGSLRLVALGRLGAFWADIDPEGLKQWLQKQRPPSHFLPAWGALAQRFAESNPVDAVNWTMTIDDTEVRKRSQLAVIKTLAELSPKDAVEWLATLEGSPEYDPLATQFLSAWAANDPMAASRWLNSLQNGAETKEFHRKAALILVAHWTSENPTAAGEWINTLPNGSLREDSKLAFSQSLSSEHPEIALAWAGSIEDPKERWDTTLGIYEDWLDANPEEFKEALVEDWPTLVEPSQRQEVYKLLYQSDETFRKEVFSLLEGFIFPEDQG